MSYGTSHTTVISSTKTEARNLNAIDASAAQRDDSSPATFPTTTPHKNRQFYVIQTTLSGNASSLGEDQYSKLVLWVVLYPCYVHNIRLTESDWGTWRPYLRFRVFCGWWVPY